MWKIVLLTWITLADALIRPIIPVNQCIPNKTIKLVPRDYSRGPVIMSDLPRSPLTSSLLYYNWADINIEMSKLSDIYKPDLDLAASVPDYNSAPVVLDALQKVAMNTTERYSYKNNQVTREQGDPHLVNILGKFSSYLMRRTIDPMKEILVTVGAANALDLAGRAYLEPGDEVVVFEPVYLMLETAVLNSRGKLVYVPLRVRTGTTGQHSTDWTFGKREFESKITRKTKMILLNNPNNPIGKAYTVEELTFIGQMATKYNLVIVADEAGLWYQYDKPYHTFIGTLPGLYERTITINSGGKMFSNEGWRLGWVVAPENLLWGMSAIASTSIYCVPTPLQIAFAISLESEFQRINSSDSYWFQLIEKSRISLNKLIAILRSIDVDFIIPTAGYSVWANFTKVADQIDLSSETDCRPGMRFLKFLLKKGILLNPCSLYYGPENMWRTEYVVRITNMKTEETIDEFGRAIKSIFRSSDQD